MKPIRHPAVPGLIAGIVLILQSCASYDDNSTSFQKEQPAITARVENLHNKVSDIYCPCNEIPGFDLVFDLAIENKSKKPQTVHAFAWAENDVILPPERGIWPIAAVDSCLTETGELNIADYTSGTKIELVAQSIFTETEIAILQPMGYYEGEPVRFNKLRIELWSHAGNRIFGKTIDIEY